jgi:hypothetical protein
MIYRTLHRKYNTKNRYSLVQHEKDKHFPRAYLHSSGRVVLERVFKYHIPSTFNF